MAVLEHTEIYLSPEELKKPEKQVIFLTGAAGYVGIQLAYEWSQRSDVSLVICLDKETMPPILRGNPKIKYIQGNTVDNFWEDEVRALEPTVVVHAAWQIRSLYGKEGKLRQWRWNIVGSQHIFEYAFEMPSVRRIIYFSTVASYGAFYSNTLDHFFTENESFRKSDYAYAEEKRVAEEVLKEEFAYAKAQGRKVSVYVLRPVSITGPRLKKMYSRFGIQSVLAGQTEKFTFWEKLAASFTKFMPATRRWARQYIHEDDIADIATLLALDSSETFTLETFNLCPPGVFVRGKEMAEIVRKKIFYLPALFIRLAFFLGWHFSFGKISTGRGVWKSYCYPILADGSKITRNYGYKYGFNSPEALKSLTGRSNAFIKTLITPEKSKK